MKKELEKIKNERIEEIKEYGRSHTKTKYDKYGNGTEFIDSNPIVITERFFKKLDPKMQGVMIYTPEQMSDFYELYRELILATNEYAGIFPTSLTTFCKLIGITIDTLKQYRETSTSMEMKKIIDTIFDEINDDNLFLSQLGQTNEKSTIFKLKAQNELTEKKAPNVNVSLKGVIEQAKYDEKLEKYNKLLFREVRDEK
jgi:hypothetical protein